ncbi:MAG TPA: hypothetical protein VIS96_07680 [Terrimicrobiaceae bacterium]
MKNLLRALTVAAALLLAVTSKAQTVSFPIVVPLHFTPISTGTYKLGIYAGIGNGATPALFELDTGATGFYVTYSPNPGVSPWWGSGVTSLNKSVNASYASGLHYKGTLVESPVTLFASSDPSSALVTTPNAKIGQMYSIVDGSNTIWNDDGSVSKNPPVNGAFYGDFGMGLTYNTNGIINLLAQLNYGPRVTPGFRIHANPQTQTAFLQIGLTRKDTANHSAIYLPMNPDTAAGNNTTPTGLRYFSQQIFNATIHITDHKGNRSLRSPGVGMLTDSGATTTLHNTDNSDQNVGNLKDKLTFELSARTTSGRNARFFKFKTTSVVNAGNVNVQNNTPDKTDYYLNTGLSLFLAYDMIYNLKAGEVGLLDEPRHRKGKGWKDKGRWD